MTDREKIRAEIERRLEDAKAGVRQNQNRVKFGLDSKQDLVIWQHLEGMAAQLLSFIDSMQEEPTSVWHDTRSEEPKVGRNIVMLHYNHMYSGEYLGECFFGREKFTLMSDSKWAYFEDLIKL